MVTLPRGVRAGVITTDTGADGGLRAAAGGLETSDQLGDGHLFRGSAAVSHPPLAPFLFFTAPAQDGFFHVPCFVPFPRSDMIESH